MVKIIVIGGRENRRPGTKYETKELGLLDATQLLYGCVCSIIKLFSHGSKFRWLNVCTFIFGWYTFVIK